MKRSTIIVVLCTILAFFIHEAISVCCYGRSVQLCGEATRFPPIFRCENCEQAIFYCAKNRTSGCNVFGCRCSGGCLTKEDMPPRYHTELGTAPGTQEAVPVKAEASVDRVKKMIDAFDNDRDGRLDMNEFGRFLGSASIKTSEERTVQQMFQELDTDKNGQITLSEIDSDF